MHSKISRVEEIIGLFKEGKNLALVSDAGTPGISDPGTELVARIREAFSVNVGVAGGPHLGATYYDSPAGHSSGVLRESVKKVDTFVGEVKIESVPGPSALTAALSIAGVPCADFTFLGFLPHKKGRETLFKEIAVSERTMVFYESPHRIMKTLDSLAKHLAQADEKVKSKKEKGKSKRVTVCRELTKIFEEVVSGSAQEVKAYFESNSDKARGEFVVMVS